MNCCFSGFITGFYLEGYQFIARLVESDGLSGVTNYLYATSGNLDGNGCILHFFFHSEDIYRYGNFFLGT